MGYTLTYSADLLRNFLQDDVVDPEAKFEALQGHDGASLLFSMGTDSALTVLAEAPQSRSGWEQTDISSAVLARDFAGVAGAKVKDFATAQRISAASAAIHMSLVIADGHSDHLYLSMNNPNNGPDWAKTGPEWTPFPFDDPNSNLKQLVIAGVFISEATDHEYIVVDVLSKPSDPQSVIDRYYIDPSKASKQAWQQHDLAGDVSASGYMSCLGRRSGESLDGLYTSGQIIGLPQLQYQPLYNVIDASKPAKASRFKLPGGLTAEKIAATRNADNTSDLYVTAQGGLYYLGSRSQQDGATASHLFDNDLFRDVQSLFAAAIPSGGTIVWGLNAAHEVFYVTCATTNPATAQWSRPVPIMNAEQISPYLDRASDANTFFAHTGLGRLAKSVKSPDTTMWMSRPITLPAPKTTTPARNFSSYTTTVRITDENNQPVEGAEVTVQALNHTHAYINYLYYVLSSDPVTVFTDSDGTITIVEPADGVSGTRLSIRAGDAGVEVNPMDTAFRKASSLITPDLLKNAVITSPDGSSVPLVPANAAGDSLQAASDGYVQLGQAYDDQQGTSMLAGARASRARRADAALAERRPGAGAHAPAVALPGGIFSYLIEAGDMLWSWAQQEIKTIAQVVVDEATGLYTFVAQIGGEYFHCVLDCIESIATGAWHLLMMIVDEIEDIIKFLEFLFEWQDITRTKEALKTMTTVFLDYAMSQLEVARSGLDRQIQEAEQAIADWAGQSSWPGLDSDSPAQMSSPAPEQSAPSAMLSYHYQNNADSTTMVGGDPSGNAPAQDSSIADVFAREGDTVYAAVEQLLDLGERLPTMPLPDVLTELVAIVGETVLESARNILDVTLDLIAEIAPLVVSVLETPLHIPVVSDVLNFFGVPDFSFLDIVCWLGAIPATLLCKIATDAAPFPDNQQTADLIAAPDYPSLLRLFGVGAPEPAAAGALTASPGPVTALAAVQPTPGEDKGAHIAGHTLAAACGLAGSAVCLAESQGPPGTALSTWAGGLAILGGAGQGVAAYVVNQIVPIEPIKNTGMADFANVLMIVRVSVKASGAVCSYLTKPKPELEEYPFGNEAQIEDWRGLTSFIDMLLALIAFIPSIYHLVELSPLPGTKDKSIAVIDETSNLTAIFSRVFYTMAVILPDPSARKATAVLMFVAGALTSVLQFAEAMMIIPD